MKTISSAIQAIIDADQNFPVTTVTITLTDGTVLYIADQAVTISAQAYTADLKEPPRTVVSAGEGIDHTTILLSNADYSYSAYDNADLFDGADVVVAQYFATTPAYTTFLGPVLAFGGKISQPATTGDGWLSIVVMADARISADGAIGRTITGRCMNTFRDANCGYGNVTDGTGHSALVATAGLYGPPPALNNAIPLQGTLVNGQSGLGALPLSGSSDRKDRIKITRAGVAVYGVTSDLYVITSDMPFGTAAIYPSEIVTVQVGDKIEYVDCPRDSMRSCARRWQIGSATRQSDAYMGLDYMAHSDNTVTRARYEDLVGQTIPIAYGSRWVTPVLLGAHQDRGDGELAAWNSDKKGPFVVALIGEGPVDTGIADVATDIELDGELLKDLSFYSDGVAGFVEIKDGSLFQTVANFAPQSFRAPRAGQYLPALSALPHVAYAILHLPDTYEITTKYNEVIREGHPFWGGGRSRAHYTLGRPGLRFKIKGRQVYTWSFVLGVATKSASRSYSTNPFWLHLDALTSPYRVAVGDAWSVGADEADIDIDSYIVAATYADETFGAYDSSGNPETVSRFTASLYRSDGNRETILRALLDAGRASPVFRNGKVGVVVDSPLGGKGTASAATSTSLTDSRRSSTAYPTVPSWPTGGANGALAGLKIKMLDGAAAGLVRTIATSTADAVTWTTPMSPAPAAGDNYAIYAVELTVDNCGRITRRKIQASHALTNRVIASFEADEFRGETAPVAILDTVEDGNGNTHVDRFGLNEKSITMEATTEWQQAIRHGWYHLRKGLDTNREFTIEDVNIEGMAGEVGDLVLLTHVIDGVSNEILRIEKVEEVGEKLYRLTCRLYREHIYADWPSDDFEALDISSNLISPHSTPPHVTNLTSELIQEDEGDSPIVKLAYTVPQWPYSGWYIAIEARYALEAGGWSDWLEVSTSRTASGSYVPARIALYETRVVFVSQVGVRADAGIVTGTSSGTNTSTTLNDTSKSWETDEWVGYSALITAGPGAGDDTPIVSNTATQVTLSAAWGVTPDGTSTYKIFKPAPSVEEDVAEASLPGLPLLDEDDGDLNLYPGFLRAKSCKWYDSDGTVAPSAATVLASGTVAVPGDEPILVHEFTFDGEYRRVDIIYFSDTAATKGASAVVSRGKTYHDADDRPNVIHIPFIPDEAGKEGVRLVADDDGATVNLGYAILNEGVAAPTWPAGFVTTGLVADPVSVDVKADRPTEGTRKAVWFNAVDANGVFAFETHKVLYLDGNAWPTGWFTVIVNRIDGTVKVIPNTDDADTGSYRFSVVKRVVGAVDDGTYVDPSGIAGEYSGNTFGSAVTVTGVKLARNEIVLVSGYFYRTSATDWATQNASMKSKVSHERGDQGVESANRIINAKATVILAASDSTFSGWSVMLDVAVDTEVATMDIDVGSYIAIDDSGPPPWSPATPSTPYSYTVTAAGPGAYQAVLKASGGASNLVFGKQGGTTIVLTPKDGAGVEGEPITIDFPSTLSTSGVGSGIAVQDENAAGDPQGVAGADRFRLGEGITHDTVGGRPRLKISVDTLTAIVGAVDEANDYLVVYDGSVTGHRKIPVSGIVRRTISTLDPSGVPVDGEEWIKYTP